MTYLLLEGEFAENQKIQGLSDKAFRLHITALTHCARNLTDGAISEIDLRKLAAISKIGRPNSVVSQLHTAGLWVSNGKEWVIHDYLVHNPSRNEILKKRALARSRKRKWRNAGNADSNAGRNAGVTLPKPPAGRRTSKEDTPPAAQQPAGQETPPVERIPGVCEGCGELKGFGHQPDCPVTAEAARKAAKTAYVPTRDIGPLVPPPDDFAKAPVQEEVPA